MTPGWQQAHRLAAFERTFPHYIFWLLRRSFANVWLRADATPLPRGGYVAAANHSSWWDGFVPYAIDRRQRPGRRFGVLMSDDELRRFPLFRWGGAFSIDLSSQRAAYAAIRYAAAEARAGAGVWFFPQGAFGSIECGDAFTSGFVHAARLGNVPILPVALRFALLTQQRPEAFVDVGPPISPFERDARLRAQRAVQDRLARIDDDIAENRIAQTFDGSFTPRLGVDGVVALMLRPFRRSA